MSRLQKKESLKEARRRLIIDTAFRIFVEQKIEPVSMGGRDCKCRRNRAGYIISLLCE